MATKIGFIGSGTVGSALNKGLSRAGYETRVSTRFDAVNAGPLSNARHLESLGFLNIQLGYVLGNGPMSGFKYVR